MPHIGFGDGLRLFFDFSLRIVLGQFNGFKYSQFVLMYVGLILWKANSCGRQTAAVGKQLRKAADAATNTFSFF